MKINMWFLQIPGVNNYENYLKLWRPLCDRIGVSLPLKVPINWSGRVNMKGRLSFPRLWINRVGLRMRVSWRHKMRCGHVRYYLHVIHTGEVLPCCNIPEAIGFDEIFFGNLQDITLMQIWRSKKYRHFKEDHYQKNIEHYRPCRICSDVEAVSSIHIPPSGRNTASLGACK
jgi:MoaA/NifB/PqqE/SkfB family radical SAM enzyme